MWERLVSVLLTVGLKALADFITYEVGMWKLRQHLQEQEVSTVQDYKKAVVGGTLEERAQAGEDLLNGDVNVSLQRPTSGT